MKNGDFVEWSPGQFHGVDIFTPKRGWIVHTEGDWAVVRVSDMRAPQCPFATFHKDQLTVIPHIAVHPGALQLS
jgi:hypothetical protein